MAFGFYVAYCCCRVQRIMKILHVCIAVRYGLLVLNVLLV